jgi:hypothetical protein
MGSSEFDREVEHEATERGATPVAATQGHSGLAWASAVGNASVQRIARAAAVRGMPSRAPASSAPILARQENGNGKSGTEAGDKGDDREEPGAGAAEDALEEEPEDPGEG